MRAAPGEPQEWLKNHVSFDSDDCLIWPFGCSGTGYAQVTWGGRPHAASRIMCILAHGPAPEGKQEVAHSCGNRKCVNPRHLRHASYQENSADKILHGRENFGERNGQAKLTSADVVAIKAMYATNRFYQREIAQLFNVRSNAVCRIVTGKRWAAALQSRAETPLADSVRGAAGDATQPSRSKPLARSQLKETDHEHQ